MITVKIVGGLGNQMFQYALGKALVHKYNTDLYLDLDPLYYDIRDYELDIFAIDAKIATNKQRPWYLILRKNKFLDTIRYPIIRICKKCNPKHILENPKHPKIHSGMYDFNASIMQLSKKDYYMEGFWQSEKYFSNIKDIIRKDFSLKEKITDSKNIEILEKISSTHAVCVHVRRSDYVGSHYEGLCGKEYYDTAISYIKKHITDPVFFVFSDDIPWCRENILVEEQAYFIDQNTKKDSYKDMILMSYCKHNIIANSTFSWRGAWLNAHKEKIVIAPKKRHANIDYSDIISNSRIRL